MTILNMARELTQEYKLAARTAREIYEEFGVVVQRAAAGGRIKFRRRKVGNEAVLNAVVMAFLELDAARQDEFLAEYVPRFERLLEKEPGTAEFGREGSGRGECRKGLPASDHGPFRPRSHKAGGADKLPRRSKPDR